MNKLRLFLFLFFSSALTLVYSQEKKDSVQKKPIIVDSNEDNPSKIYQPTEADYKYFKEEQDTLIINQDLTINSYYQKNFTQKDYFGKLLPNNIGKTFNDLSYFPDISPIPKLLPAGKKNNFLSELDIRYFDVKTPTTEFDYESGVKEGHALSTLFTHSPNSRINYFLQYRGLRSLGKYQYDLAVNNALIVGLNYHTQNKRYRLLTHYIIQNIDNQENGGITNRNDFEDKSNLYSNRLRLAVNLQNVESEFTSRRFHAVQYLRLFGLKSTTDSIKTHQSLDLKSFFTYEDNQYYYSESQTNTFFPSPVIDGLSRRSENRQANLENKIGLEYNYKSFIKAEVGHLYNNIAYAVLERTSNFPSNTEETLHGAYASIKTSIRDNFNLNGRGRYNFSTYHENPYNVIINASLSPKKGYSLFGHYMTQSSLPKFNYQLNHSFYSDYTYYNPYFKNEHTQKFEVGLNIEPIKTSLSSSYTSLDNLLYIDQNYLAQQFNSSINILAINIENTLTYKRFNLTTQARYQNITQNEPILPLPQFIGRATLYYQAPAFKNKAEIQTGINVYYFSGFQSREISPIQNEFKLQSLSTIYSIGETPIVDYFLNLRVKRMHIDLKFENISSFITKKYYVLPNVPYTDFRFRFGIRWYLFT